MLARARLQTVICCARLEETVQFYTQTLGLPLIRRTFNGVVADAAGSDLCICEVPDFEPGPHTIIGLSVREIDVAISQLTARGVTMEHIDGLMLRETPVASMPDGGRVAWLRDPAGNLLSIVEYSGESDRSAH